MKKALYSICVDEKIAAIRSDFQMVCNLPWVLPLNCFKGDGFNEHQHSIRSTDNKSST
jgi:hypothetical protein